MNRNIEAIVKYRIEQAEEALKDAEILFESGGSLRSVINRSYYAMFYAILALIAAKKKYVFRSNRPLIPAQSSTYSETLTKNDSDKVNRFCSDKFLQSPSTEKCHYIFLKRVFFFSR